MLRKKLKIRWPQAKNFEYYSPPQEENLKYQPAVGEIFEYQVTADCRRIFLKVSPAADTKF